MNPEPWQLNIFNKSFKKKEKLKLLKKELVFLNQNAKALFITCGGNSGAINYKLRQEISACWFWAELEKENIPEMETFLKEKVYPLETGNPALPFDRNFFDLIIILDVLEHIPDPLDFSRKILCFLKPGGKLVIGTPTGNTSKPLIIVKKILKMKPEIYGHLREGFSRQQLAQLNDQLNLQTIKILSYSRFFTELLELMINFSLLKIFSRKFNAQKSGNIAPQSSSQFNKVAALFKFYRLIYPFFLIFSLLDKLLFFTEGYFFNSRKI